MLYRRSSTNKKQTPTALPFSAFPSVPEPQTAPKLKGQKPDPMASKQTAESSILSRDAFRYNNKAKGFSKIRRPTPAIIRIAMGSFWLPAGFLEQNHRSLV